MQIGLGINRVDDVVGAARNGEALGFDFVHAGEHVFFHGPTPNGFVALSAAAAATREIKLLSAVTLLPLYPAAIVAKMASVLDVISGGRFYLGIGVGGEFPREFAATGVGVSERGARTTEGLEILTELLAGRTVTYEGRWATLDRLRLDPPPVQAAGPPIWLAGRGEPGMRRAGRFADVWMPYMVTPEQLEAGLTRVRAAATEAGRDSSRVAGALYGFVSVDADGERARGWARDFVGQVYKQDFSKLERYLVAGTPEQCIARLREFESAGADSMQINLACPPDATARAVRLFAEEVLPAVRDSNDTRAVPPARR